MRDRRARVGCDIASQLLKHMHGMYYTKPSLVQSSFWDHFIAERGRSKSISHCRTKPKKKKKKKKKNYIYIKD